MDKNKVFSLLTIAVICISAMLLTSCTEDQMIGMSLTGTWRGSMSQKIEWKGHYYTVERTEITFNSDPFRTTKGDGYWFDYYTDGGYVANHIRWEVNNQVIRVHFLEDGGYLNISDFRINNDYFEGYIYEDGGVETRFSLVKVADYSCDWNSYHYGWDYFYNTYYYAPATRSNVETLTPEANATVEESTEAPIRHVVPQGETK